MEPNPQFTPTPRYAAVVPPGYKGGEKRLVLQRLSIMRYGDVYHVTKTRQNSPACCLSQHSVSSGACASG